MAHASTISVKGVRACISMAFVMFSNNAEGALSYRSCDVKASVNGASVDDFGQGRAGLHFNGLCHDF
jgi:hypothetical protein